MEAAFNAEIAEWQEFFTAVASVAGTLVGLLFVALGLNPAIMADDSPAGRRVWAGQTFHSFLVLLIIGLIGLVPTDPRETLTITLVILGVQGIARIAMDIRRVRADPDPDPQWRGRQALMRFVSPSIAYVLCLWLAYRVWELDADALGVLIAIVFFLTISAAASCWDLLKSIGDSHREETEGQSSASS
jgi:hypothetical protein